MKQKRTLYVIISNITLSLFAFCCVVPFFIIIIISLSDRTSIQSYGYQLWPSAFSLEAYRILFEQPQTIIDAYGVTIFITFVGTLVSLIISSQLAYVLAREEFFLKKQISFYVFFTMLFSGGMVPTYMLITQYLGLKNNLLAIILPMLVNAWNVFLLRTFFASIPKALIESAKIDGADEYTVLYRIVIPMSTGALATVCIFILLSYWNDWYGSLLYISNPKLYPLQYLLYVVMGRIQYLNIAAMSGFSTGEVMPEDSMRMATCVIAVGPMIFIFPFFQKYFVKGVAVGAVKG